MPTPSKRGTPRWTRSPPILVIGPGGARGLHRRQGCREHHGTADGRPASTLEGPEATGSPSVGTRSAKKAGRWALDARPAQGRVGVISRHAVRPLAASPASLGDGFRSTGPARPLPRRAGFPAVRAIGLAVSLSNSRRPARTRVSLPRPGLVPDAATSLPGPRPPATRRAAAGRPGGKESVRHDHRNPAVRPASPPSRPTSAGRANRSCSTSRLLVRPLPADAPGRRATGRRRATRSSRSTSTSRPTWPSATGHRRPGVHRHRPVDRPGTRPDRGRPARRRAGRASITRRGRSSGPGPNADADADADDETADRRPRRRGARPAPPAPVQPQALGDGRPDQGPRQRRDRVRLGHDHPQHARGVDHPDLRPHLQADDGPTAAAVAVPPEDHGRPVRRQARRPEAEPGPLRERDVRGQGDRLRLLPRRRPDPHPAGPPAAVVAGRPAALEAEGEHGDDHRRLLRRARRDGLEHGDRQPGA